MVLLIYYTVLNVLWNMMFELAQVVLITKYRVFSGSWVHMISFYYDIDLEYVESRKSYILN